MEAFSYPVRPFACRTYPEELRRTMDSNDEVFFRPLCAFAGAVAGETGVEGLRLDFRCGLRLEVPEGDYHVRLTDGETGVVLFEDDVSGALLVSEKSISSRGMSKSRVEAKRSSCTTVTSRGNPCTSRC